jgi:hypothetical protein
MKVPRPATLSECHRLIEDMYYEIGMLKGEMLPPTLITLGLTRTQALFIHELFKNGLRPTSYERLAMVDDARNLEGGVTIGSVKVIICLLRMRLRSRGFKGNIQNIHNSGYYLDDTLLKELKPYMGLEQ